MNVRWCMETNTRNISRQTNRSHMKQKLSECQKFRKFFVQLFSAHFIGIAPETIKYSNYAVLLGAC